MKNNICMIVYIITGSGGYDIDRTSITCTEDYQLAHNRREIVAASD